MLPNDGMWGVAERIMLSDNNEAAQKTLDAFPAWTRHDGYCVIEQRRADCCAETAFLFSLLYDSLKGEKYRAATEMMLDFLYFRSGLLNRSGSPDLIGTWQWSHIKHTNVIYFDDDSWMAFLALKLAKRHPEWDEKYSLTRLALCLADHLAKAFPIYFREPETKETDFHWRGNTRLPHWGALVCMALAEAYRINPNPKYADTIAMYEDYMLDNSDAFTTSEYGYVLLGCVPAWQHLHNKRSFQCAKLYADKIVAKMDPGTGNVPSEHYETPNGKNLVDTIYTMNWALLGMQNWAKAAPEYKQYYDIMLALLLKIQDGTPLPHLNGCWRGMFDLDINAWGGGDRFEGGANSIYTGWTNAPIGWLSLSLF